MRIFVLTGVLTSCRSSVIEIGIEICSLSYQFYVAVRSHVTEEVENGEEGDEEHGGHYTKTRLCLGAQT